MRRNGKITAALLVAALAAAGCSKDKTSQVKNQEPQRTARALPVSMITPASDKGIDAPAPKISGPASFADGERAYQAGKFSEATKVFEEYTVEKPGNAWGHFMLGLSASKGGDLEKAEKAFEEAIRIDPKHVKSLLNLSRTLIDQGRFEDALGKLTQAGELDSNSAEVHRLMGRTYNGIGKKDDAIDAYRQAIAMDEKDAWSMNNLGLILLEQGRPDEATPYLAKAVELRKDVAIFHNNLGMALEHTGRFSAAVTAYNGALTANPGYEKAQRNLARVEAVKVVGSEKPFDLEAEAKGAVEKKESPIETATVTQ
jgi:tetratricopeptide (TPR) repeat protein